MHRSGRADRQMGILHAVTPLLVASEVCAQLQCRPGPQHAGTLPGPVLRDTHGCGGVSACVCTVCTPPYCWLSVYTWV